MEELEQKLPEMPETVTETVGAVEAAETAEIAGSGKVEKAAEASEIAKDTDAGETEAEKSAEDPEKAVETVYRVVDIRFRSGGKTYFFDPGELMLSPGDEVIIDTARGPEYGICSSAVHKAGEHEIVAPLLPRAAQSYVRRQKNCSGEQGKGKAGLFHLSTENRGTQAGNAAGLR